MVLVQIFLRDALHIGRGDFARGVFDGVEERPISGGDPFVEIAGDRERAVALKGGIGEEFRDGRLDFGRGDTLLFQSLDFLERWTPVERFLSVIAL